MEHRDVIIVGAGPVGIGTAVQLQRDCPEKSCLILEGRSAIGGTWDQFRYPGVRSDTDAYTYAYEFRAWPGSTTLADGAALRDYIQSTASGFGVDRYVRFRHRLVSAEWSSATARWLLHVVRDGDHPVQLSCNFLAMCSGYFSYRSGHRPDIPGLENFEGLVVHPQEWPEGLDCRGKRVVVIGSGATAVTLVPALAREARHVVMLQRSPSYVMSIPANDPLARVLRALLPEELAHRALRLRYIALYSRLYRRARRHPEKIRRQLLAKVGRQLRGVCDVDPHFSPRYMPWDQRLCLVPDGDLFTAIRDSRASVVTGRIARLSRNGVTLESGEHIDADVIITATGLEMVTPGEARFTVDGVPIDFATTWTYKGRMFSGVPNLVHTIGYVNSSWMLRAGLTAHFTCRVLKHLDATDTQQVTPRLRPQDCDMTARPWIDSFTPGYMQRAMPRMPRQGDHAPWLNLQDYRLDRELVEQNLTDDGALVFGRPRSSTGPIAECSFAGRAPHPTRA